MLTNRTKYAIKSLLHLARHRGLGLCQAKAIAAEEHIPRKFLELILADLRLAGLIRSKAGNGGGHELARPPAEIPLLEIIRVIEGPAAPLPCLSRTAYARCADCPDERACGTRRLLANIYQTTFDQLSSTTLADGWSGDDDAGDAPTHLRLLTSPA